MGRDRGQPVSTDYQSPFTMTGATIDHVIVDTGDDLSVDLQHETTAAYRRD